MAFVSRAERKLVLYQNSNILGPGSYIGQESYKKSKSRVPFSSSSQKSVSRRSGAYTPGPGSYIEIFEKKKEPLSGLHSSSFASQCDRFNTKLDSVPGPGSYNIQGEWVSNKTVNRSENSTNWVRLPSAPSIPKNGFGYEINNAGELIMMKPPDDENVGPGYYDPKLITSSRGIKWKAPKTKNQEIKTKSPGPGAYDVTFIEPKYKEKASAPFISKTKKVNSICPPENETELPGPGMYMHTSSFTKNSNPYAIQNFGSKCERFRSQTPDLDNPGPGTYSFNNSFSQVPEVKVAFQSNRPRFSDINEDGPGPGSYEPEETLKKPQGKPNALGGAEKRFICYPDETPGPGLYTVKKIGRNSAKQKGLSAFISKTKRISPPSRSSTPAPGTYEVSGKIGEVKQIGSVVHPILIREGNPKLAAFNTQSLRFTLPQRNATPGPGTYVPEISKSSKAVIFHKNARFKQTIPKSPGPGSYRDKDSWNKKTFNTLFEYK